ncbi:uncharacterized protein [Magallana gigas]|uniref:uncharacterized protein isoform X1 n=1 Tax=Magallana gigas TaxID=29159 RepID=UPI003340A823
MADVEIAEEPGNSISNCRFRVREFNNKIKDAELGHIYDDVPCKDCEKSILKEANELNKECGRLIEHYYKDEISPSQSSKVYCDTCWSKEDTDNASQDNTCIKKVMSKTRKRIRQYNDHLDDLNYKDGDGRPCKTCRERILRECQGLVEELQRANNQFQESNMKNKCPCDYSIECEVMHVELRGGKKGRSNVKQHQHDCGYHSVSSDILRREPTESMDDNQTASADTTQPKHLNMDTHTVAPSCSYDKADLKGQCVTLEVSMDDSNTTDA